MKILVTINELNIRGGTHKQVLRLCEYLSKNNEVIIYTKIYEKEKTYPEFEKFNIVSSNIIDINNGNIFKKIISKLKNYKIEKTSPFYN